MSISSAPTAPDASLHDLRNLLTESQVLVGTAAERYLRDSSTVQPGAALAVVLADSADDVAEVLKWASAHSIPVVPRGAGTGTAGGAAALSGGIVLSTERMNRIVELRPSDRLAVVQPGVIVAELDAAAAKHGLMYAPDPASWERASIGGTIATNAGGLRCLRHGVTADSVSALRVVLADGRHLRTGAESRKNVAGYDLTHLFVGSEGTLGIVTEATVRLQPIPRGESLTFQAVFGSVADAGRAVAAVMASSITPEILELIDGTTIRLIEEFRPSGFDTSVEAVLVGQVIEPDSAAVAEMLGTLFTDVGAHSFKVSSDDSLLAARRLAFPALEANGMGVSWISSDAAVPPSRLSALIERVEELSTADGRMVSVVAHAGDGNIHAAVSATADDPDDVAAARQMVLAISRAAVELGGTVTGEHGIGSLKLELLDLAFDGTSREIQRRIKDALDPAGILNPGRAI